MTETYPSDAELSALSGTSDPQQEVLFIPIGQSPYYTNFYRMQHRLLLVAARAGDFRVYKDGDLTFGVRAGRLGDGPTNQVFAGASAVALSNNAVNYIYLTAAAQIVVSTSAFPAPAITPHLPLATIATGSASASAVSGQYSLADIVDCRGQALYHPQSAMSAAAANRAAAFFTSPDASRSVLGRTTADQTPTELTLDSAAPSAANRFTLDTPQTCGIRLTVTARQTTGQSALFSRQLIIRRVVDTVDLVGAVQTVGTDINPAAWSLTVQADNVNKSLQILVTGSAASSIRWSAVVDSTKVVN